MNTRIGLASVLIFFLVGCANPFAEMRDANRAAISRVELGMSKAQVESTMGQRFAQDSQLGRYENPYKRETVLRN